MKLKSVVKNVYFYSVLTKILMAGLGLAYSIIVARYLGPELKGQLSYINSITATAVSFCSLGIHQAYPYYKRQKTPDIKRTFVHAALIVFLGYTAASLLLAFTLGSKTFIRGLTAGAVKG